ncbi:MAG: D-aminoacyl-tRNA deacylase [Gammaproteobacteria bacterium]|nr:D-aminoacyl-tRNA deacylase [Gammaproteobacteria bacterium]MDH3767433.1 D-aminoacyl-tRNA deacylase [Gammaproteobacteria bacterium]
MIGLIQRVSRAAVTVAGTPVASIDSGVLVLVGVEKGDTPVQALRLAEKICGYRVFPDTSGRMNRSVLSTGGSILLVPQFTLVANTDKGMRASFTSAAAPEQGEAMFSELIRQTRALHDDVQIGAFGAHMELSLVNDGPVTFWLKA